MGKPKTLLEASCASSRIEELETLKDILAAAIDSCDSMRDLASLSRQYRETSKELDELRSAADDEPVDTIGGILDGTA